MSLCHGSFLKAAERSGGEGVRSRKSSKSASSKHQTNIKIQAPSQPSKNGVESEPGSPFVTLSTLIYAWRGAGGELRGWRMNIGRKARQMAHISSDQLGLARISSHTPPPDRSRCADGKSGRKWAFLAFCGGGYGGKYFYGWIGQRMLALTRPNGFPSPPRVSLPKRDERFALCGPRLLQEEGCGALPRRRYETLTIRNLLEEPK